MQVEEMSGDRHEISFCLCAKPRVSPIILIIINGLRQVFVVVRAVAANIHPFILEEKHTVSSKNLKEKLFEAPITHTKCFSKHNPICLQYKSTFTFTLHSVVTLRPLISDDVEGKNDIKLFQ